MFIVPLRLQPLFNFVWLCKSFLKGQERTQSLKSDSSTNSFYINNFNSKLLNYRDSSNRTVFGTKKKPS